MTNFFELFNLPVNLDIDVDTLRQKYLALQNVLHPDRFANASEGQKMMALQKSTLINDAFQTLKQTQTSMRHMLELQGIEIDESKTTQDMNFLMQQMALREQVSNAKDNSALEQVKEQLAQSKQELRSSFSNSYQEKAFDKATESYQRYQFFSKLESEINLKLKTF